MVLDLIEFMIKINYKEELIIVIKNCKIELQKNGLINLKELINIYKEIREKNLCLKYV